MRVWVKWCLSDMGTIKCPKKHAFFLRNALKLELFQFRFILFIENGHVLFPRNASFVPFAIIGSENGTFQRKNMEVGHLEDKARDQF